MRRQQSSKSVWGAMAVLVVITAAGVGVHRSGISLQVWQWQTLGEGLPVLWLPLPWYRSVKFGASNCTVQVRHPVRRFVWGVIACVWTILL